MCHSTFSLQWLFAVGHLLSILQGTMDSVGGVRCQPSLNERGYHRDHRYAVLPIAHTDIFHKDLPTHCIAVMEV